MMLGTLFNYLDRQTLALLSPMILRETHISAQGYGEVISCFSFAYMLSTPLWGSILDRIGLRLGMSISIAIWAAASVSHSLVSTLLGFAIARAVLGFGEGSMFPGGFRTAMDSLPPQKQARGLALAYSGSSVGSMLAPLIILPVAVAFGWRPAFLVTPAAALLWLVLWRLSVKETLFPHRTRLPRLVLPNVLERRFWALVFSYGLGALPVGAINYLGPLYLSRAFHMSARQLGWVLWIPPAGLEAGYFFWGWIADHYCKNSIRPAWLYFLLAFIALPAAAAPLARNSSEALALLTVTMFAAGGLIVVTLRSGGLTYGEERRGLAAGIASSSFSLAVAIVLPVCGHLFDAHRYHDAFLIVGMLPFAGTLVWFFLTARGAIKSAA